MRAIVLAVLLALIPITQANATWVKGEYKIKVWEGIVEDSYECFSFEECDQNGTLHFEGDDADPVSLHYWFTSRDGELEFLTISDVPGHLNFDPSISLISNVFGPSGLSSSEIIGYEDFGSGPEFHTSAELWLDYFSGAFSHQNDSHDHLGISFDVKFHRVRVVPEPGTLILLLTGCGAWFAVRKPRHRAT